ncbi:MAG: 8-oxo-dGTP pyrophosphatase MutT (NUDIX family) [Pseudohongiellaceae bacterium]|jgi:8-oxo-dGTP pyrophosphatase MutT (NUDIX family)
MTNTGSTNSAYAALLAYFSDPSVSSLIPISHPDKAVNLQADREKHSYRKAAVLLPITRHSGKSQSELVLTVRSANLKSHAGQISLPGGMREDYDADFEATALRESEEEIGLKPDQVEVIGKLGDMALPSGFQITPIVGLIDNDLVFTPSPDEVADIFQAPLELILDPQAYRHSTMFFESNERAILELMYEDYRIWGATAAILYHLANEVQKYR